MSPLKTDLKLEGFPWKIFSYQEKKIVLATVSALQTFTIPAFCFSEEWELVLKVFYLLREGQFHISVWWLLSLGQVGTIPLNLMWPPIMKTIWENRWGEVLACFSVCSLFQSNRDTLGNLTARSMVELFPWNQNNHRKALYFEQLWMTSWLQGNAHPVVWIFLDLFRKSWCLKIHVLSPSLPWLGKPRGC